MCDVKHTYFFYHTKWRTQVFSTEGAYSAYHVLVPTALIGGAAHPVLSFSLEEVLTTCINCIYFEGRTFTPLDIIIPPMYFPGIFPHSIEQFPIFFGNPICQHFHNKICQFT